MTEYEESNTLTVDEILDADDIEEKWVDVPEWPKNGKPGRVKIRPLNLRQLTAVARRSTRKNASGADEIDREMMMIQTLLEGMIEPKLTIEAARKLGTKSAGAVTRIASAINALGPTQEAVEDADKSVWSESDAPVPIRAGAGIGHDVDAAHNGNAYQ